MSGFPHKVIVTAVEAQGEAYIEIECSNGRCRWRNAERNGDVTLAELQEAQVAHDEWMMSRSPQEMLEDVVPLLVVVDQLRVAAISASRTWFLLPTDVLPGATRIWGNPVVHLVGLDTPMVGLKP